MQNQQQIDISLRPDDEQVLRMADNILKLRGVLESMSAALNKAAADLAASKAENAALNDKVKALEANALANAMDTGTDELSRLGATVSTTSGD